jgi:uncharacterized protein YndB with AHSA1/START domain
VKPIVLHRRLPHPVDRVWRAIADPAELAQWFPGPHGEFLAREELRVLEWTGDGHTVRFDLQPDGEGCRLTFTHTLPAGDADQFARGWEIYFSRLDALLAGGAIGEQEAHDEREFALGDGPELRLERHFFVGVDRLWRALTDAGELQYWFPGEMEVLEAEPPRLLVARWNGSTLRFALAADGDFARLTFVHAFDDRDLAAQTAAGWDRCLARLEAVLNEASMDEAASLELWLHVHDRYAERFDVDPAIGRRAFAEHTAS